MKNVSPFFYVHADMSGDTSWNKIGIGITPYSVVRARQKYCSQPFYLDHLYFGDFEDISELENIFKYNFQRYSAKYILGTSATELYKMNQNDIVDRVNELIKRHNLKVQKLEVSKYKSTNSKNCILKMPDEKEAYDHSKRLIKNMFKSKETVTNEC